MFRRTAVLAALALFGSIAFTASAQEKSEKKAPGYKACPKNKVWNDAQNGCVCAPGFDWDMATRKCLGAPGGAPPPASPPPPPKPAAAPPPASPPASPPPAEASCAPGKQWSDAHGACVVACPSGKVANAKGDACVVPAAPLASSTSTAPAAAKTERKICGAGKEWSESKRTCIACAPGTTLDSAGATCVAVVAKNCPEGKEWKDAFGGCVPLCPADHVLDFNGSACHPIKIVRRPR